MNTLLPSAMSPRQPGSMKDEVRILPGFDEADNEADKEIEAIFYGDPMSRISRS
jgi:hypothetical protein